MGCKESEVQILSPRLSLECMSLFLKHMNRGVAQLGSAPASGAGGRKFKSSRPDHALVLHKMPFSRRDGVDLTAIEGTPTWNFPSLPQF